jgi:hypothetical protein
MPTLIHFLHSPLSKLSCLCCFACCLSCFASDNKFCRENSSSTSIFNVSAGPTPSQLKGAYFGALVADSLRLGSHYEYDAPKIKKAHGGDIDRFMAPDSMGGPSLSVPLVPILSHLLALLQGNRWAERPMELGGGNVTITPGRLPESAISRPRTPCVASPNEAGHPIFHWCFLPIWANRLAGGWKQWVCTQTKNAFQVLGLSLFPHSIL